MNTRPGIVLYAPAAIRHEPLPDVVTSLHVLPVTADGLQPGAGTIIVPARLSPRLRRPRPPGAGRPPPGPPPPESAPEVPPAGRSTLRATWWRRMRISVSLARPEW